MVTITNESAKKRYRSVLEATLDELREKGLDKTKIQEIASRSGVAIGTIYSYFISRENLIYLATQGWVTDLTRQQLSDDPSVALEARMEDMIHTSAAALFEEPELLRAWVRTMLSTDENVVQSLRESRFRNSLAIYPKELVASREVAADLALVMEHVWFASMVRWSLGQKDATQVPLDVVQAVDLVLAAHGLRSEEGATRRSATA